LSELLYLFNKENILFDDFKVLELNGCGVAGEAYGEKINPERKSLQTEIKAVTFHGLKIQKNSKDFSCNIIFDV
jgi:SHS2 domain-containing protein